MTKTLVVIGFGPGISTAVAEKYGAEGYAVALVARSADRLAEGVAGLTAKGVTAAAIVADAGDPASVRSAIDQAREALGPIGAIHWNAYSGSGLGDLLTVDPATAGGVFDIAIVGLLAAVQGALPDLKAAGDGAVLVTNGAFGLDNPMMDALGIALKAEGVAIANAAKHKLVGLLAERLKAEGVHVAEVMVAGAIKGTGFAAGGEGIDAAVVASKFWELHQSRSEVRATVSG